MFDAFSMRARQVLFAARLKAGGRGGTSIDVDDFLLGLVLEDQGMLGENLLPNLLGQVGTPLDEGTSHIPFFAQEAAKNLVTTIEAQSTLAKAVSLATEIPLSTALERCGKLLQKNGITQEKVLDGSGIRPIASERRKPRTISDCLSRFSCGFLSHLSLAFASAVFCHRILDGSSTPPARVSRYSRGRLVVPVALARDKEP